jgi:inward rectifier potassium channel
MAKPVGSTRVFGHEGSGVEVEVVGMRRRPGRDLYHWLVTGPWRRLLLVFGLVYLATQAVFAVARLLVAARWPATGGVGPALLAALSAPPDPGPGLSARAVAAGALATVEGFVHWAEVVIASGIVLAKFSLVKARVLFSDVAVIGPHGDGTALLFRMANERASHIVDARVSAMLVRNEEQDGDVVRRAHDLALARGGSALFSHAWTAVHPVDEESPLADATPAGLEASEAEIIVNISGFDEALEKSVHARHVYPAGRIRWNARFKEIVKRRDDGTRVIDYRRFHRTEPAEESAALAERGTGRRAR